MEFITVEQFQEQPKEIQEVFLNWWKCDYGDLYYYNEYPLEYKDFEIIDSDLERDIEGDFDYFKSIGVIPIFTEGQLRKFIEEKAECSLDVIVGGFSKEYIYYDLRGYEVKKIDDMKEFGEIVFDYYIGAKDLLQAYWKVACMIAKEEVDG